MQQRTASQVGRTNTHLQDFHILMCAVLCLFSCPDIPQPFSFGPNNRLYITAAHKRTHFLTDLPRPSFLQIFDFLRGLPADNQLSQLCDVFTYTAMVSLCVDQQELSRAFELVGEMKQRNVERNVHTYT